MLTLADIDSWSIVLPIGVVLQIAFNAWYSYALFRMRANVEHVKGLESKVERVAEQLIESKLTGVVRHLEGLVGVINERVSNIKERLKSGDTSFAELDRRDRELEARFNRRMDELKDYLHQHFATKQELHDLRKRVER